MNQIISLQGEFCSFKGSISTSNDSSVKSYQIKLKRDSLDSQVIEKQNLIIQKLKNDNLLLKTYLSRALTEIKTLKTELHKFTLLPTDISSLHENIYNLDTQNTDLKKELEQIQSQLARYKDTSELERDCLMTQIMNLKRQVQETYKSYETLQYENSKKEQQFNEKQKQIWELQSNIAELTEKNYQKQSFIDKLKAIQDKKNIGEDFRYFGSKIQKQSQNSDDILIEGQEYIMASDYEGIKKSESGVQTQNYEVFQFSSRCVERSTPSKRKNHHMSPETDKQQRIREYARQLTQKQKECSNQEKTILSLRKDIINLEEKIKHKQRQVRKYHKKCKKLTKKLHINSQIDLSDSILEQADSSVQKNNQRQSILEKEILKNQTAIQTQETTIQNLQTNPHQKSTIQKANHKKTIQNTTFQQETSKKERRRKNRTIEQDEEDGREKLKSLIQDLEKKDSLLVKMQQENIRNRQTLNETRNKLRKKQNECKRLTKDLKGLKSELSENNASHDGGKSSRIEQDCMKTDRCEAEIQTSLGNNRFLAKNLQQSGKQSQISKKDEKAQNLEIKGLKENEVKICDIKSDLNEENQNYQQNSKSDTSNPQSTNKEELRILLPNRVSPIITSHISPRSQCYSHRESGQKIVNVQKLEKQNQLLRQQNYNLKYELQELRKSFYEGLKNIQREYCSESGSDFHSERQIIGAFSDRQLIPRKFKEKFDEDIDYENKKNQEKREQISIGIQTEDIEEEIEDKMVEIERKRSSRILDDKSQKSQAKSDQHHNSISKNELEVSSETDEYQNNELRPVFDQQANKKRIKHHLSVSQQKARLKNNQNHELRKEIRELKKSLIQAKKKEEELLERLKQEGSNIFAHEKNEMKTTESPIIPSDNFFINKQPSHFTQQKGKQLTHNHQLNLTVEKKETIYQEAEVQTEDHEAVEISCIERTPDKNIDLSLRNENLFDLEQPITNEQQVQTEDADLSFYRSFKVEFKEGQNIFDSSKLSSDQIVDKNKEIVENSQEQQKHHQNKVQEKINWQSMIQIQNHQVKAKEIIQQIQKQKQASLNHQNQKLKLKITELQSKIQCFNSNLQKEKCIKGLKQNQQKQQIQLEVNYDVKVESRCPSYMEDSHISNYRSPLQYENAEVQTEVVEHSFSMSSNLQPKERQEIVCKSCQKLKNLKIQHSLNNQPNSDHFEQLRHNLPQSFVQSTVQIVQSIDLRESQGQKPLTILSSAQDDKPHKVNQQSNGTLKHQVQFEIKCTESKILIGSDEFSQQPDDKQKTEPKRESYLENTSFHNVLQNAREKVDSHNSDKDSQKLHGKRMMEDSIVEVYIEKSEASRRSNLPELIKIDSYQQLKQYSLDNFRKSENAEINLIQITNTLSNQVWIYKEELSLTQQQNFRLQRELYEFTMRIKCLNKEISALKESISSKNEEIENRNKQLQETKLLLGKLKTQHDRIIVSLDQYVDDSSDGNTPDKRRLTRDFDFSTQKQRIDQIIDTPNSEEESKMISQVKINGSPFQMKETQNLAVQCKIKFTHQTQPQIQTSLLQSFAQQQRLHPRNLHSQCQLTSTQPQPLQSNSHQLSFEDIQTQGLQNKIDHFTISETNQLNEIQQSQSNQNPKPENVSSNKITAQNQINKDKADHLIETSNKINHTSNLYNAHWIEAPDKDSQSIENSHASDLIQTSQNAHLIQSSSSVNLQAQQQSKLLPMIIQQTKSEIVKCKQCLTYSTEIKKLQELISKLNNQIEDLTLQIKNKKSSQKFNFTLKPDISIIQNDQPLIEHIKIMASDSALKEDKKEEVEIKTVEVVIKQSQKEEVLAFSGRIFQPLQEAQLKLISSSQFDTQFSLENINNLPFIFCDYQPDFVHPDLQTNQNNNIINTSQSSLIENSSKNSKYKASHQTEVMLNDVVIEENQRELEQLYEPCLIVNSTKFERMNKVTQKSVDKQFIDQNSQTYNLPQNSQKFITENLHSQKGEVKMEQTPILKPSSEFEKNHENSNYVQIPEFPMMFVTNSAFQQAPTDPLKDEPLFNPIFIASCQNIQTKSIPKDLLNHELDDVLLQTYLTHQVSLQPTSEQAITEQLTILAMKIYHWIIEIRKSMVDSRENHGQRPTKESKEEALLLDEEDHTENKPLGLLSRIPQPKKNGKQLIKEIVASLGTNFLYIGSKTPFITQQEYSSIASQIQSKFLQSHMSTQSNSA